MKTKVIGMTDDEVMKATCDYVVEQEFDSAQIYTSPECDIFNDGEGNLHCQVWVMLPKELKKADW